MSAYDDPMYQSFENRDAERFRKLLENGSHAEIAQKFLRLVQEREEAYADARRMRQACAIQAKIIQGLEATRGPMALKRLSTQWWRFRYWVAEELEGTAKFWRGQP